jgi:hypothetical protein
MNDFKLALCAAAAYDPQPIGTIIDWHDLRVVLNNSIISVRGTVPTNLANWLRDFNMIPIACDFGYCHAGFLHGAINLFPLVSAVISGEYILLGHSLGGAVAILLGALLIQAGKPPSRLVTFEAPRVGGSRLAQMYVDREVTQYRYGNDPVTEVPFLPCVYEHLRDFDHIGKAMIDPIQCHFISRTIAELQALDKVASSL